MLGNIFGPDGEEETGAKLHIEELHNFYSSPKNYLSDEIEKGVMGEAGGMIGEKRNYKRICVGKLNDTDH
jgi:hypothetical protein